MALRPRDKAAGGPREAQAVHRERTRGRRPRVSTQVHADAREGHHMACEIGIWRAHGLVGPCKEFGEVTQMCHRAPIFKLNFVCVFFRVGLCSHTSSSFASDMATQQALDAVRTAEIAWTRVHAIIK